MVPIAHSWLLQGQRKATVETTLAIPEGSVQWTTKGLWTSNSGKIVGLISCVWKSDFMKSSHHYRPISLLCIVSKDLERLV